MSVFSLSLPLLHLKCISLFFFLFLGKEEKKRLREISCGRLKSNGEDQSGLNIPEV